MTEIDPGVIAFDIDGVVADTMAMFLSIAREKFGITGLTQDDMKSYMLEECLPIEPSIIRAIINDLIEGNHETPLTPVAGAVDVLGRIAKNNAPLVFVTARPRPGPIVAWLHRILPAPPQDIDVYAVGSFEGKIGVLKDRNRQWFVEDRLETCFLLQDAGIRPVVFARPWNRKKHPFCEVGSWEELTECIKGL